MHLARGVTEVPCVAKGTRPISGFFSLCLPLTGSNSGLMLRETRMEWNMRKDLSFPTCSPLLDHSLFNVGHTIDLTTVCNTDDKGRWMRVQFIGTHLLRKENSILKLP